jgi:oligopeptide/dipeptide ABC transporter ATP-binding protein
MSMPISGVSTTVGQPGQEPATGQAAGQPLPPATHALARMARAVRSNRKATTGTVLLALFILVSLFPGVIAHDSPSADAYAPRLGPSTAHLLGTTAYGQDMFAQLVWGTRNVLIIAFVAGLATTGIAVLVGVAAAYLGGLWDGSLSVLTDVLLVIPLFPLLIVIAGYAQGGSTLVLILVLTLTSWSYTARQLRSQALSLRGRDFLEAARVRGERRLYIIMVRQLGFAIIFVTHDMSLVSHFSDRLMVMYAGQVAEFGATRQVFDSPLHPYSIGLLDAFPSIKGPRVPLTGIPGSPPDLADPPDGCRFEPRCPKAMDHCRATRPNLYQVDGVEVRCLLHADGSA